MTDKSNPGAENADKKPDAAKAATPSAGEAAKSADPKRPHATLDLKAIEVTPPRPRSDAKPAAPAASDQAKAGTAPGSKPATTTAAQPAGKGKAPQPAPSPSAGVGAALTHLMAGVIGGAMAWYGVTTLGPQLGLPVAGDTKAATEALQAKVANLEKSLSEKAAAASGDVAAKLKAAEEKLARLDGVSKTVTELNAAQAKLAADAKALAGKVAATPGVEDAASRIAKLEEQLRLMADAAKGDVQAGKLPQLAAIAGSLTNLDERLTHDLAALRKSVNQELEQRRVRPDVRVSTFGAGAAAILRRG